METLHWLFPKTINRVSDTASVVWILACRLQFNNMKGNQIPFRPSICPKRFLVLDGANYFHPKEQATHKIMKPRLFRNHRRKVSSSDSSTSARGKSHKLNTLGRIEQANLTLITVWYCFWVLHKSSNKTSFLTRSVFNMQVWGMALVLWLAR